MMRCICVTAFVFFLILFTRCSDTAAGQVVVELTGAADVTFVGAMHRWDADGNPRSPVDPKATIDRPAVDAEAKRISKERWKFDQLPPGRYDLVLLTSNKMRIEGFHYPPVLEFDPILLHDDKAPEQAVKLITEDIAQSRHYENKVTPLFFVGDEKQIRVLIQLLRDQPTSYDRQFGEQAATIRHEVWQYINRYGGWAKERRTRVFDRILAAKRELREWTWVWQPTLGGIEIAEKPVTVSFELPKKFDAATSRGLLPY